MENKSLEAMGNNNTWNLFRESECTAPRTPQQNSLAETAFPTILNKAKAMIHAANISYLTRHKIAHEAVITATKLDGLILVEINGKSINISGMKYLDLLNT